MSDKPQAGQPFDIDCELVYELTGDCDFLFQIHALHGMGQELLSESLTLSPALPHHVFEDPTLHHRFLRLRAGEGTLGLHYRARVRRLPEAPAGPADEMAIAELPDQVLHDLMPSRYCESDLLGRVAQNMFGQIPPGLGRVQAICDWVHQHLDYEIGSTTTMSTARDVFLQRAGVCRDFSHLAMTFCRALNIPARLVTGYARFDKPPPDFHAVFEAYLGGRWVMFDPTRMSPVQELVRIGTGRDAKDVAFATIFGPARMTRMSPCIDAAC